jgi:HK97 family phage major capsid protein
MEKKEFDELVQKVGAEAAKEIKSQAEAIEAKYKAELDAMKADTATKKEFEAMQTKLDEQAETLQKQAEELTKFKNMSKDEKRATVRKMLNEALSAKKDALLALKSNSKAGVQLEIKAAGTMTTSNILPDVATAAPYMLTDFEAGIEGIARRQPFIRQIVNVRPISTMYAAWAEKVNPDGGAATTAQGADKSQADFDVQEKTAKVEKITAFMKTSKENLDDIQAMLNEIESELMTLLELEFDRQILSGDGISPNLKGILEYDQAFSIAGTVLENNVKQANNFDALRAAAWQVYNAHFIPNYFLINPVDAAMMELEKTDFGVYVLPPFSTNDGKRIAGMIGVENTGITAGSFTVGDFTKSNLRIREEMVFDMGYINDDWKKNLINILVEMRAVHYIKSNHVNAFVSGTFEVAKAALLMAA